MIDTLINDGWQYQDSKPEHLGFSSDADYVVALQKAAHFTASRDDERYAWYQEERAKVER